MRHHLKTVTFRSIPELKSTGRRALDEENLIGVGAVCEATLRRRRHYGVFDGRSSFTHGFDKVTSQ